jgi:hypothetical protein
VAAPQKGKTRAVAHFDQIFDLEDGFLAATQDLRIRYGAQAKTVHPLDAAAGLMNRKR